MNQKSSAIQILKSVPRVLTSDTWWYSEVTGAKENGLTDLLESSLTDLEAVLQEREWLAADRFTVADLLMADVPRVKKIREFGDRPASESYVKRITERPAFKKAHTDQMTHFKAADKAKDKD